MSDTLSAEQRVWRWKILISTYIGYMGYYVTRKAFTICKKPIADHFDWELSWVAHIWTAYLVAYMVGQFANSFIGRKWGPRIILLAGLGISIACGFVFGISQSYWTFMLFMVVNGLVQATGWPGVVGAVAEWLRSKERGAIMGIWSTSHTVGNLVLKALGGLILGCMGWRWAFFGCSIFTISIWWLLYFWQRNRPEDVGLPPIVEKTATDERALKASEADHITFRQYLEILMNPLVIAMGCSYFCIKFMRYALDSWLPAFLSIQGMKSDISSYSSGISDIAGFAGAIFAGWALDRVFRGRWALLCFFMGLGTIVGYLAVLYGASTPLAAAMYFGIVGFMIYGPDVILCGPAAVELAGAKNGVAVAGIINGIASVGPIFQEEVIGWLMRTEDKQAGIRNTNLMGLFMSIAFVILMIVVMWGLHYVHKANHAARRQGA